MPSKHSRNWYFQFVIILKAFPFAISVALITSALYIIITIRLLILEVSLSASYIHLRINRIVVYPAFLVKA